MKIIDFGLSKDMKGDRTTKGFVGTPEYLAPELLRNERYGKQMDFWALGQTLFEIAFGISAFASDDRSALYEKILHTQAIDEFKKCSDYWFFNSKHTNQLKVNDMIPNDGEITYYYDKEVKVVNGKRWCEWRQETKYGGGMIDVPEDLRVKFAFQDLIVKLLNKDPQKRLGANGYEEIMQHPFFAKKMDWDALKEQTLDPPVMPDC